MDPVAKKILNNLSCPLCKAPIDLLANRNIGYNYGCAANDDHYVLHLITWDVPIRIDQECVNFYDSTHMYKIVKQHSIDGTTVTFISVYDTDLEGRVIFSFKEKKILMNQNAFDFTNFDENKALNRIKTIFLFQ
jgi:hypothetical protein